MTPARLDRRPEFDRQVQTLLDKGYPALAGMPDADFRSLIAPLRDLAVGGGPEGPADPARVPFLLVIGRDLAPAEQTVPLTALAGRTKPGFVDRHFADGELKRFDPLPDLVPPGVGAYLAFDVDRGTETLNVRPDDAVVTITAQHRSPLTIEEGIALVTQFPAILEKNNCFSLPGSRCGDRRVPALWISAGAPKLGWCWAGNPHTWLGSASCAFRAAAA